MVQGKGKKTQCILNLSNDEHDERLLSYRSPTFVYVFILAFEAKEKTIMMEYCLEELVYDVVFYLKEVGC
jgi:hypothetical protein